jgi:hypothetical protein
VAIPAGLVAQGAGQMRFARPGRASHRLLTFQKPTGFITGTIPCMEKRWKWFGSETAEITTK